MAWTALTPRRAIAQADADQRGGGSVPLDGTQGANVPEPLQRENLTLDAAPHARLGAWEPRPFDPGRPEASRHVVMLDTRSDAWDAERFTGVHAFIARRDGTPVGEMESWPVARTVFRRLPGTWDSGTEAG